MPSTDAPSEGGEGTFGIGQEPRGGEEHVTSTIIEQEAPQAAQAPEAGAIPSYTDVPSVVSSHAQAVTGSPSQIPVVVSSHPQAITRTGGHH